MRLLATRVLARTAAQPHSHCSPDAPPSSTACASAHTAHAGRCAAGAGRDCSAPQAPTRTRPPTRCRMGL